MEENILYTGRRINEKSKTVLFIMNKYLDDFCKKNIPFETKVKLFHLANSNEAKPVEIVYVKEREKIGGEGIVEETFDFRVITLHIFKYKLENGNYVYGYGISSLINDKERV